jgi:hypothetical protein
MIELSRDAFVKVCYYPLPKKMTFEADQRRSAAWQRLVES